MKIITLLLHDERFSGWSVRDKLERFHFSTQYMKWCTGFGWKPYLYSLHQSLEGKEVYPCGKSGMVKVFPVDFRFPPFLGFANDHNPKAILKEMVSDQPDLVHYHHYYIFSFPYIAQFVKSRLGRPLTTQLHSYHNGFLMHLSFLPCIAALRLVDLVFYSYQPEASLYKSLGLLDKAVKVPIPSIPPDIFKPGKREDSNRLLYVGRIPFSTHTNAEKSLIFLLHLMRQLLNIRKDVSLTVIGDGPALNYCRQLATKLDIGEYVNFLGAMPRSALPEYYQEAALTLAPIEVYDIDGWFDGEIQESLACGTPVAALKPSSEASTQGTFGFLLFKDCTKAAEQVSNLLDKPGVLRQKGEMGSEFVRSKCSESCLAESLRTAWESVMKR